MLTVCGFQKIPFPSLQKPQASTESISCRKPAFLSHLWVSPFPEWAGSAGCRPFKSNNAWGRGARKAIPVFFLPLVAPTHGGKLSRVFFPIAFFFVLGVLFFFYLFQSLNSRNALEHKHTHKKKRKEKNSFPAFDMRNPPPLGPRCRKGAPKKLSISNLLLFCFVFLGPAFSQLSSLLVFRISRRHVVLRKPRSPPFVFTSPSPPFPAM